MLKLNNTLRVFMFSSDEEVNKHYCIRVTDVAITVWQGSYQDLSTAEGIERIESTYLHKVSSPYKSTPHKHSSASDIAGIDVAVTDGGIFFRHRNKVSVNLDPVCKYKEKSICEKTEYLAALLNQ